MGNGRFVKGNIPHNKGIKLTLQQIERMKESYKNRKRSHRNGISRHNSRNTKWKNEVLTRDNATCTVCGCKENLDVHHIIPWKENIELRFDVTNGKTLCRSCHMSHEYKERKKKGISTEFKRGMTPWNKGLLGYRKGKRKPHTEEAKKKMSLAKKGIHSSEKTEFKKGMTPWNKGIKK